MYLVDVDTRNKTNNLTLIRTLAALSVTFGHSYPILSGRNSTLWFGMDSGYFGFMPVAIFFAISGYLVTQSFCNSRSWVSYLEARILRIFPGLFFANIISIILIILFVLSTDVTTGFVQRSLVYLMNTLKLGGGDCFEGVFASNPVNCVNGSLWTLPIEFRYYLLTLALGLFGFYLKRIKWTAFILFCVALATILPSEWSFEIFKKLVKTNGLDSTYLGLVISYVMGTFFYLYRDKVYLSLTLATGCAFVAFFAPWWWLKIILTAYACFVLGFHPKLYIKYFPQKYDLSYGIYVLSYPVQQTIVHLQIVNSAVELFIFASSIVIPLSLVSWKLVEEPTLRLKGKTAAFLRRFPFFRINEA